MKVKLYRFKTELEFITEFGQNWENILEWYDDMSYLLGTELTLDENLDAYNAGFPASGSSMSIGEYEIWPEMLQEISWESKIKEPKLK